MIEKNENWHFCKDFFPPTKKIEKNEKKDEKIQQNIVNKQTSIVSMGSLVANVLSFRLFVKEKREKRKVKKCFSLKVLF